MDVEDVDSNDRDLDHIRAHSVSPTIIIQLDTDVSTIFRQFCYPITICVAININMLLCSERVAKTLNRIN